MVVEDLEKLKFAVTIKNEGLIMGAEESWNESCWESSKI